MNLLVDRILTNKAPYGAFFRGWCFLLNLAQKISYERILLKSVFNKTKAFENPQRKHQGIEINQQTNVQKNK